MRRAVILTLALMLTLAGGATAQDQLQDQPRNEAVYQGLWCLYLNAFPYLDGVPEDVSCDYEPRSMTKKEAGAYYLRQVAPLHQVIDKWNCAAKKTKGQTWRQQKKWVRRLTRAERRWGEALSAVEWPANARKAAATLIDRTHARMYWKREAYRYPSFQKSYLSGTWAKYAKASDKASEAAGQVRLKLGLKQPPRNGNDCKLARSYERQRSNRPKFENPFDHPDLKRVATLLAGAGLVETQPNAAGEPSLFLTDEGLATARSMAAIGEDATSDEVAAGLFAPVEAAPEPAPSPSPEAVELTLPEG